MRSDMEDIPEELETPENLICHFLDRGDAGDAIIKMLAEFGFEIVKAAPPVPAPIDEAAALRTKIATAREALEAVRPFLEAQSDRSDRQHVRVRAFELSLQIGAALKDTAP